MLSAGEIKRWTEQVLNPVLCGELSLLVGKTDLPGGGLALLSADTDKIKEYVFETSKLPEIRGASMILDELNWGEKPTVENGAPRNLAGVWEKHGLPNEARIYSGGGSILALVPGSLAETLEQEITALYPRETGVATITCVCQLVTGDEVEHGLSGYTLEKLLALRERLTPNEWQRIANYYHEPEEEGDTITEAQCDRRKNFGELVTQQSILLRRAKEGKSIVPFVEAVPYARRCGACGVRPAAEHVDEPDPRYLCRVCSYKFGPDERRGRKSLWACRFEDYLRQNSETTNKYMAELVYNDVQVAMDLSEVATAAKGRAQGYVGVIYADGNEIGRQIEASARLAEYKEKSEVLRAEISRSVYEALGKHLKAQKDVRRKVRNGRVISVAVHPFEIVTIGGDDLLLIVPGDRALSIALDICRAFESSQKLTDLFSQLTLSAGVVIADSHTPIYFMRDLAEQLLKSAKKRAREELQGTVDFLVLKSQTTLSTRLSHLRSMPPLLFTNREQKEKLYLTGRPYTLAELDLLIESGHILEGFPASQLQSYRKALQQGRMNATFYFLYQYARAQERQREALSEISKKWSMQENANILPWLTMKPQREYIRYWTPWADIVEIMDFVPRPNDQR